MSTRLRDEAWSLLPAHEDFGLVKDRGITVDRSANDWHAKVVAPNSNSWVEQWSVIRLWVSETMLHEAVDVNPKLRNGVPVLRDTRITIAQLIGEVADGRSTIELAEAFDLDSEVLRRFFEGLAIQFDRSFLR
jgi:uncharacterized protein (DUF433 family)